jgi:hypothetical protein
MATTPQTVAMVTTPRMAVTETMVPTASTVAKIKVMAIPVTAIRVMAIPVMAIPVTAIRMQG